MTGIEEVKGWAAAAAASAAGALGDAIDPSAIAGQERETRGAFLA